MYGVLVKYANLEGKLYSEIRDLGCDVYNIGEPLAFYGAGSVVYCPDYDSAKVAADLIKDEGNVPVTLFKVLEKL